MIKGSYFITTNTGTVEKTGYVFDLDGLAFGICKDFKQWTITELSTGFKVGTCLKRYLAEEVIKNVIPTIKAAIENKNDNTLKGIRKDIIAAYKKAGFYYDIVA